MLDIIKKSPVTFYNNKRPNSPLFFVIDTIINIILSYQSRRQSIFYISYNIHNRSLPQQAPTRLHSGDNDLEIGVGRVYWLFALQRASSQIMRYPDDSYFTQETLRFFRKLKCL